MSSDQNQAWQIPSPGTLVFKQDVDAPPAPSPTQILIRIHAVSLNYRDIVILDHSPDYPLPHKKNLIPASDGAGTILSTGSAVKHWKVGDSVIVHPNTWLAGDQRNFIFSGTLGGGEEDGTLQKYFLVEQEHVLHAPKGLTFGEASTLYTAGVTAWNALFYGDPKVEIGEGTTVLTQGTGGVSCYAIQVCLACLWFTLTRRERRRRAL